MRTIPEWVKEGAEVVEAPARWSRTWGKVHKIGKVRKDGMFALEGRDGLWKPGNWGGASPCKGNYAVREIWPFIDERKQEAERSWMLDAARSRLLQHIEKLEKACKQWDEDVILAEAAKLPPEESKP